MVEGEPPKHRSRCRIFADILRAIQDSEQAKLTRILHEANLSYDRLVIHLADMERLELIEKKKIDDAYLFLITKKGRRYLSEFKRIEEFGDIFGVDV